MPYPNDPDVMRGDKDRYYVVGTGNNFENGIRKGPYTQSDAIRVATDEARKARRRADAADARMSKISPNSDRRKVYGRKRDAARAFAASITIEKA